MMSARTYWEEKSKNLEMSVRSAIDLGCEYRDIPIASVPEEHESRAVDIAKLIAYKRLWKASKEYDSAVDNDNFNLIRTPLPYIVNDNLYESTDAQRQINEARCNLRFDFINRINIDGQVIHVGDIIKVNECCLTSDSVVANDIVYGMVVCFVTHISDMQEKHDYGNFSAIVIDTDIPANGIKSFTNSNDRCLRCVINSRIYSSRSLLNCGMSHAILTSPNKPFDFAVVKKADFSLSGTTNNDVLGTKSLYKGGNVYIEYETTISSIDDIDGRKVHVVCGNTVRKENVRTTSHSGEYAYCVSLKADDYMRIDEFRKFREQTSDVMSSLLRAVSDPRESETGIKTLERIVNESLNIDLIELSKAPSKRVSHRIANASLLYAMPSVAALKYDGDSQDEASADVNEDAQSGSDDVNHDDNDIKTRITVVVEPSLYASQYTERNRQLGCCAAVYDADGHLVCCDTLPKIIEGIVHDGYAADQVEVVIDHNADCLNVTEFKEWESRFGTVSYELKVEYIEDLPELSSSDAGTDITEIAQSKYQSQKQKHEEELRRALETAKIERQQQQQAEIAREIEDVSERLGSISQLFRNDPYLSDLFDPDDDPDDDDAYY